MKEYMVILLGSDENVYGFARSFHELYNIKPIALSTRIMDATKDSNIIDFIIDENLHKEGYLAYKLKNLAVHLKKKYKKLILIPCSDTYMELIIKYQEYLTDYENKFIPYKDLKSFNDKVSFYNICEKYHILYPKTLICYPNNYMDVISKIDFDYPIILKPNNSNSDSYLNATFNGKEKVYFINNLSELTEKIKLIYSSSYKEPLIIQKYVNGDDTNMRVLNVYSNKHGKVTMMSLGQPILEEYHPKTYGNYASIISLTEHIPLMDDIRYFLESINYKGPANFDIKMDSKTHKYYVFEINPRPGRSSFFSYCAGCGYAKNYIDDLIYDKPTAINYNKNEILWLNIPYILLRKYLKNKDLNLKVKQFKKNKNIYHVLIYDKDYTSKRKKNVAMMYAHKLYYFPKYYIDKK